MSKKNNQAIVQAEVLRPVQSAPIDAQKMIGETGHKQKVAEIMVRQDDFVLQPFFLPKKVSDQIKWLQSVPEQRAWSSVFEKHGCIVCGRQDVAYCSCGCCIRCYQKIRLWKKAAIQEIDAARPVFDKPRDLVAMAQEALAPSIKALIPANDPSALKVLPATTAAKTKKTRRP
jgi:hypothetical protein